MKILNKVPRSIPFIIKLKTISSEPPFVIGSIFFFVGIIMVGIVSTCTDFKSITFFPDQTTKGKLIHSTPTGIYLGTKSSRHPIYKHLYKFNVGDQTYSGESYSDHIPPSNPDIEYESKNPESSCIEDMDFAELPLWLVLLMCVVPIAGIFFIIRSIRESFEDFYWMAHGLVAKATFVRMEETDIRMNKRKQVSVVYQFTTEDGETIFMNFLKNKSKKKTKPRMELVMYDPRWPENAKMLWYPVRQYLKSIGEL